VIPARPEVCARCTPVAFSSGVNRPETGEAQELPCVGTGLLVAVVATIIGITSGSPNGPGSTGKTATTSDARHYAAAAEVL
jgi:hypothetical protein